MHPNHVRCANVDEGPCDKLTSSLFAELHSTASWTSLKSKFLYWYVIHARESTLNASSLDETVWYQRMQSVFRQLSKMPTDSTGTPGIRDSPQPLEGSRLTCPKCAVNWSFYMPFRWLVTKKSSILKQIDALCEVISRHLEWLWVCVCVCVCVCVFFQLCSVSKPGLLKQDNISSGFQRRTNSLTVAGYVQQASA